MKNNTILIFFLLSLMIMVSCGDKEELAQLQEENAALKQQITQTQESAKEITEAIHDVHSNLMQINMRKHRINELVKKSNGNTELYKDEIIKEMGMINTLEQMNKQKFENLYTGSNELMSKDIDITKMIEDLETYKEEEEKAIEIVRDRLSGLNYELELLNNTVDSLTFMNEISQGVLELQASDISTCYYVIGDYKSLSENKIVERKGGVAGLGSVPVILDDFDKTAFKTINIFERSEIEMQAGKAELVSTHPNESYELIEREGNQVIVIKDPKQFWHASRYLIILTK